MGKIRVAAIITAVIGLGDSIYLSWTKLFHADIICMQNSVIDCNLVNSSSYSEWHGIPISLFGVLGYLLAILFLLVSNVKGRMGIAALLGFFGVTSFGFIYSIYLTYLEVFIIKALCQWCLVSAIAMTILFVISVAMIMKSKTFTKLL
jgi:uncharacterized membrane protein